jgi:hypothetical protein
MSCKIIILNNTSELNGAEAKPKIVTEKNCEKTEGITHATSKLGIWLNLKLVLYQPKFG